MPISLCQSQSCEAYSTEVVQIKDEALASPGDDPESLGVPKFMRRAREALQIEEHESIEPRPLRFNEDLILEPALTSPFTAEIMKKAWFVSEKVDSETLPERVKRLKRNVGISTIYDSAYTEKEVRGVKYKPVARKVVPVLTQDPEGSIPQYNKIHIGDLLELPVVPTKMEELH